MKWEVFAAIDRDSVWHRFGLVPGGKWARGQEPDPVHKANRVILLKMRGIGEKKKFWPE